MKTRAQINSQPNSYDVDQSRRRVKKKIYLEVSVNALPYNTLANGTNLSNLAIQNWAKFNNITHLHFLIPVLEQRTPTSTS